MKTTLLILILTLASSAFAQSQTTVNYGDYFLYNGSVLRVDYVSRDGVVTFSDGEEQLGSVVSTKPKLTAETPQGLFLHRTFTVNEPQLRSEDNRDSLEIAHIAKVIKNSKGDTVAYELSGIHNDIVAANGEFNMKVENASQTMADIHYHGQDMNIELHTQSVEAMEIAKATGRGGKYPDWKGVLDEINSARSGVTQQAESRFRGMDPSVIDFKAVGEESVRDVGGRR